MSHFKITLQGHPDMGLSVVGLKNRVGLLKIKYLNFCMYSTFLFFRVIKGHNKEIVCRITVFPNYFFIFKKIKNLKFCVILALSIMS